MEVFVSGPDTKFEPNCSIKEFGVQLTPRERARIERRLHSFSQKLPPQTTLKVSFFGKGLSLKASFYLYLHCGKFFRATRTYRLSPLKIYDLLEKEIEAQFQGWKSGGLVHKLFNSTAPKPHKNLTGGYAL